jgi:hypothetical protein
VIIRKDLKMRNQHKTIRGRVIDMDALRTKHGSVPAVGNGNMNARGDIIDKSGGILVERDQLVQAYYANNPKGVKHVSLKQTTADMFETPQQAVERLTKQINSRATKPDELPNNVDKMKRKLVDKTS